MGRISFDVKHEQIIFQYWWQMIHRACMFGIKLGLFVVQKQTGTDCFRTCTCIVLTSQKFGFNEMIALNHISHHPWMEIEMPLPQVRFD